MTQNGQRCANRRQRWPVWRALISVLAISSSALVLSPLVASDASATPLPATVEAWIYPGSLSEPTCNVPAELAVLASDPVALLKPEYLTVRGNGKLGIETAAELPCNGFSPANLAEVRAAAHQVYVTVSAGPRPTKSLLANPSKVSAALTAIESFVTSNGLNGVDLDFEPNEWTTTMWSAYMSFVGDLVGTLSAEGRGVEVDLEPFTTTPRDAERYGDVASAGAHLVVMAYDHEYDVACAPITPYTWLQQVVAYAQSQVASSASHCRTSLLRLHDDDLRPGQARHFKRRLYHHAERTRFPDHPGGRGQPARSELRRDPLGIGRDLL